MDRELIELIEHDSAGWVVELLDSVDIWHGALHARAVKLMDVDAEHAGEGVCSGFYTCRVEFAKDGFIPVWLFVGGMINEGEVLHSAIWNGDMKLVWVSQDASRKRIGIRKFNL